MPAKEKGLAKISKPVQKLAVIDDAQAQAYMVLNADKEQREEITLAVKENIGDGMLGVNDLDRLRMPVGGVTNFVIPGQEGEEGPSEVVGIIAAWKDNRAYWEKPYGSGPNVPPDCVSDDGKVGMGKPGGDCATCPMAQFGSGVGGRRQACKAMRTIFILEPGGLLPIVLSAPPTSLKGLRQYFLKLSSQGAPYYGVVTKLTLAKKVANGLPFSYVVPTAVGKLSSEQTKQVRSYADAMRPALVRIAKTITNEAAAKPPAGDVPDEENYGEKNEDGDLPD